jgi:hypothetical protein
MMALLARQKVAGRGAPRLGGAWACGLALALFTGGCTAGPLVVSAVQSRGSEVKFGYTQARGGKQGIIECQASEAGDLHDCRHMQIEFAD